jgi:hypothetical protein
MAAMIMFFLLNLKEGNSPFCNLALSVVIDYRQWTCSTNMYRVLHQ